MCTFGLATIARRGVSQVAVMPRVRGNPVYMQNREKVNKSDSGKDVCWRLSSLLRQITAGQKRNDGGF